MTDSRDDATLGHMVLRLGMAGVALFAIAGWAAISITSATPALAAEFVKSLLQLAVVVIGGAVLKAVLDESNARRRRREAKEDQDREREARLAEFRQDKLTRLVAGNDTLRHARILIPAYRSAAAYRNEFLKILDVASDFRTIRHQINALDDESRVEAFSGWADGGWATGNTALQQMTIYLENLNDEFKQNYPELSALQSKAENKRISDAERAQTRQQISGKLDQLPRLRGFLRPDQDDSDFEKQYNALYSVLITGLIRSAFKVTVAKAA